MLQVHPGTDQHQPLNPLEVIDPEDDDESIESLVEETDLDGDDEDV